MAIKDTLSKETSRSISVDCQDKFLVLLPLNAEEKIEALKHYFGNSYENDLVVRAIFPMDSQILRQYPLTKTS
jgi:hypothetical protein